MVKKNRDDWCFEGADSQSAIERKITDAFSEGKKKNWASELEESWGVMECG